MSKISVAELLAAPVSLTPQEAVALTLAAADALRAGGVSRLPPLDRLLLSSTGHVSLESVTAPTAAKPDEDGVRLTAELAALARRLLRCDAAEGDERRSSLPGALLVLLARALGQIDLPPPPYEEFRAALERFGAHDPAALAALFWRAAGTRVPAPVRAASITLPPVKVESALSPRGAAEDRRHHMPSASELRRYLREVERELYEARTATPPLAIPVEPRRAVRVWRTGVAVASTIGGAVIGTALAFVVVGSLPGSRVDGSDDAFPAAVPAVLESPGLADAAPAMDPDTPDGAVPVSDAHAGRAPRGTTEPLLLSSAVGRDVFAPSYAPTGAALYFHAGGETGPLMRATISDGGTVTSIETLLEDGASNRHVAVSPDGARIAFDSDREGVRGVYVARADGSRPFRLGGPEEAMMPAWSPSGEKLAFVRADPKSRAWHIWTADVASRRLQQVTSHPSGRPQAPSWFPDARRIAYAIDDRLMVADLDSGVAQGYHTPRQGRAIRTPAVSPDGRRIVFQVEQDGVWLLDLDQARMRRVLAEETAEAFAWSPAGDAVAYHARREGAYGLWRLKFVF